MIAYLKEILENYDVCMNVIKDELLEIKETRTPIELFERLAREARIRVARKEFYFINPHYEVKFGLKARKLNPLIGKIPYVRNFFTTSCFYLLEMA